MVIRNIVSSESITVQSNYCLNFLPEKERNETKYKHNTYKKYQMSSKSIIVKENHIGEEQG